MPRRSYAADVRYTVLTFETDVESAETLADRARVAFGVEPVQLFKPDIRLAWIDLYFTDDAAARLAARVSEQWPSVHGQGLRRVDPQDWQRFWQRHFHAQPVGARLMIVPQWDRKFHPLRGRKVVRIQPGMSFGTGDHITTRFCLEAIDRLCRPRPAASLLDAGTGSGILAIAAAKLGVPRIVAIDSDPLAVAQARENLRMNRVAGRVRLRTGDITSAAPLGRFDVVCANLFGGLLIRAAARLCRAARRRLVLGGIREIEADAVADAYAALGAREIERDGDGEWCGLVFDLAPIAGTADQGAARNPRKGNRRM